ncbi:amidohydrolase family protein [Rhodohalobacter sulfatireducens]|uniref:Amidohydrolase n=1 Tax=Rhodohalobacter sulfatireducens TaxID=2911366 RepID=A0ABS9K9I2_9BACT|nr:amidohydrolase family protein [Rhodohalobacter sulfatireducens]MCG2587480.1 amidohydrolase [Rhodohalobacter sulfatireducens]
MSYSKSIHLSTILLLSITVLFIHSCSQNQNQDSYYSQSDDSGLLDTLLLKDWMPESVHNVPKTEITTAQYPIIDMHAHDYAKTEEELEKRIEIMDATGIERSLVLTKKTGAAFESVYALYSKYPDRFDVYCGIDYTGYEEEGWSQKAVEQIRRDVEAGCEGFGELHDKGEGMTSAPGMHPDDPRMDLIWQTAAEMNLPVNLHVAEPIWMYEPMDSTNDGLTRAYTWRVQNQDQIVGHDGMIEILDRTLERHPNTTFVAAHLANTSNDFSLLANLFDKHENFYADISARFAEFSTIPRTTAAFFEKYQDRIVYGTDYGFETFPDDPSKPYGNNTTTEEMLRMTFRVLETADEHFYMTDLVGYKWPMYGLDLSDEALQKIYRDNALKILSN